MFIPLTLLKLPRPKVINTALIYNKNLLLFQGPGEECGGPWDLNGKCAHNLTCTLSELPEGANFYFFRIGICLPANHPPENNDLPQ